MTSDRERTHSWGDPGQSATAARTMAGVDAGGRLLATAVSSVLVVQPRPGTAVG